MTFTDLHKILDDEKQKLSLDELKQVLYELKQDCFKEQAVLLVKRCGERHYIHTNAYYMGEKNAFQIALDLIEHFIKPNLVCDIGDTIWLVKYICGCEILESWEVYRIDISKHGIIYCGTHSGTDDCRPFGDDEYQMIWFTDIEQARAKLKELKEKQ